MGGHLEMKGQPAVFWNLRQLVPGDLMILQIGEDQLVYRVMNVMSYWLQSVPSEETVGPAKKEILTVFTCDGTYVSPEIDYDHRLIVRAERIMVNS